MGKLLKLALAAAATLSLSANAALVDDFSDPMGPILTTGAQVGATTLGGMLGGERDVMVKSIDGGLVTAHVAGGKFIYGQSGGAVGEGILRWDGDSGASNGADDWKNAVNTSGLGGADLTANANAGFRFTVFTDGGTNPPPAFGPLGWIEVDIWDMGGNTAKTFIPAINASGTFDLLFTDPDWIFTGAFSFANVGAIQVTMNVDGDFLEDPTDPNFVPGRAISLDVELSEINGVIPEPGSIALAGLALLGLGAARRRKN